MFRSLRGAALLLTVLLAPAPLLPARAAPSSVPVPSVPSGPPYAGRVAVWLRPPASAAELERTLVAAKRAGFTDVLLEGFYHGRAIWTSQLAPPVLGYDALALASRVSAREGLHLSLWMETLYWRPAARFGVPVTPLWRDDYATRDQQGRTSLEVSNLGFVDPAVPQVGELLSRLVGELAARYPDVGLNLDYLRYPRESDFGFVPQAIDGFRARSGLDARTLRPPDAVGGAAGGKTQDEADAPGGDGPGNGWAQWSRYRQELVTALANRLIAAYRDAGGRGPVSADVYGGPDPLQNWRAWKGLQVAIPMLYYPNLALYALTPFQFPPAQGTWPGIQVGGGRPPLREQLERLHALGYANVAVFGWTAGASSEQGEQPR